MLVDLPIDGVRDRVLALRTMPAFEPLEDDDLVTLAERARFRAFPAGAKLLEEGGALRGVHAVLHGKVRVTRSAQLLAEIDGRGTVGLISILAEQPAPEAVALTDTRTVEIPAEVISTTALDRFDIARNSVRLIALELLAKRGQLPVPLGGDDEPDMGTHRPRSLTLVEKMISLRQLPFFANANLDAVAELAKHARERRFEPGEVLWRVGDAAHWGLRIDYGRVACVNDRGERVVVGGGHALGALDGIGGVRRCYSATAVTDVIGLEIRAAVQLAVLEVHPTLANALRKTLATLLVMSGGG